MNTDATGYYTVSDEGIDMFNQLAQLRIYGEDQFKETTDRYPGLIDLLYNVFEGDWLSDSTAEACEGNKDQVMNLVEKSIRLYAATDYED